MRTATTISYHIWKVVHTLVAKIYISCHKFTYLPPKMLVLYETAMGYCLFKVTDAAKLESPDLWKEFESPERASKLYDEFLDF